MSSLFSSSCLFRVIGPDPQRVKAINFPYYDTQNGLTSLSASATLYRSDSGQILAITSGDLLKPFLRPGSDSVLLDSVSLSVLMSDTALRPSDLPLLQPSQVNLHHERCYQYPGVDSPADRGLNILCHSSASEWIECSLVKLGEIQTAQESLQTLMSAGSWDLGWSVSPPPPRLNDLSVSALDSSVVQSRVEPPFSTANTHLRHSNGQRRTCSSLAVVRLHIPTVSEFMFSPYLFLSPFPRFRGLPIQVRCSPYGLLSPHLFHNSVASGVVANFFSTASNDSDCTGSCSGVSSASHLCSLVMTDCRCLPGSEGGSLLTPNGQLLGIVTLPLRDTRSSSPVLLNLAITIEAILPWLESDPNTRIDQRTHRPHSDVTHCTSPLLGPILRSVVLIRIGSSWASGVVLTSDGYVVTNAHLVRPAQEGQQNMTRDAILVRLEPYHLSSAADISPFPCSSVWQRAACVYLSRGAWDLALLKVELPSSSALIPAPIASDPVPAPGSSVFVVGHALFGPSARLSPSVTAGVMSKVVSLPVGPNGESAPVLLQSSAAVQNGNSGGALTDQRGDLLGLVTSNVQHTQIWPLETPSEDSAPQAASQALQILPNLNFSIPALHLMPLRRFAQSNCSATEEIDSLDSASSVIHRLWQLEELVPRPRPEPPQGKGLKWRAHVINSNL